MGAASRVVGREAGRGLLTLANLITAVAPVAADWNDSHIFNQRWPSHARFHGVVALAMTSGLAGLNLWSLWSPSTDRRTRRLFAAAVPVGYWAPFWIAPLVPGTGVDDPPHPIARVVGRADQPAGRGGHDPHRRRRLAAGSMKPLTPRSSLTSPMAWTKHWPSMLNWLPRVPDGEAAALDGESASQLT